jgi:hypothetical protein
MPLDLPPQTRVVGPDAGAHVLRVRPLRGSGKADQVAEENAHDLALLADGSGRPRGQRRGAKAAEPEAVRILLAARRAGRHQPSLGAKAAEGTPRKPGPPSGRVRLRRSAPNVRGAVVASAIQPAIDGERTQPGACRGSASACLGTRRRTLRVFRTRRGRPPHPVAPALHTGTLGDSLQRMGQALPMAGGIVVPHTARTRCVADLGSAGASAVRAKCRQAVSGYVRRRSQFRLSHADSVGPR